MQVNHVQSTNAKFKITQINSSFLFVKQQLGGEGGGGKRTFLAFGMSFRIPVDVFFLKYRIKLRLLFIYDFYRTESNVRI